MSGFCEIMLIGGIWWIGVSTWLIAYYTERIYKERTND